MSSLLLHKEAYGAVPLDVPGVGRSYTDFEVVTAIEPEDGPTLSFNYFSHFDFGVNYGPVEPEQVDMPTKMAERVLAFCGATFVDGHSDFNCYSFVNYALGWDNEIRTGARQGFTAAPALAEATEANKPYMIYSDKVMGGTVNHLSLGTHRAGYAFNVVGPSMPLAFNTNAAALRLHGANALQRIIDYRWG